MAIFAGVSSRLTSFSMWHNCISIGKVINVFCNGLLPNKRQATNAEFFINDITRNNIWWEFYSCIL